MYAKIDGLNNYVWFNEVGQFKVFDQCHNKVKEFNFEKVIVALSIDEDYVVVSTAKQIYIYMLSDFSVFRFYNIEGNITCTDINDKYLLVGGQCGSVYLTNVKTNELNKIIQIDNKIILSKVCVKMDLFSFLSSKGKIFFF